MAIIIIRTVIVFFTLVIFMRLMGKRQLKELELPELVVALLIADLGAHPLQDIGIPLMNGLIPIMVLFCCEILLSGIAMKSIRFRRVFFGLPSFLIVRGKIDQKEMAKNRFTLDELMEELRYKGIYDLAQVEYAVLETSGELNVMLYPDERPVTPKDMGIHAQDTGYPVIIINNGRLLSNNLRVMGRDESWLQKELAARGISGHEDVFLFILDEAGRIYFAAKEAGQ